MRPRCFKSTVACTLTLLVMSAAPALAGDYLSVTALASKAEGAVIVRVTLGSRVQSPKVDLVRVIRGSSANIRADNSWLGLCLPSRMLLKKWTVSHPKWPARKLWAEALKRGTYEVTVFMRTWQGAYVRFCETEAMDMRHTDLHPAYQEYLKSVETHLDARTAPQAH